jgi:hypothetical protein
MNHDCVVDVADFGLFAGEYGKSGFSPADFNDDQRVSSTDFAAFASSYFTSPYLSSSECESCGPIHGCGATARVSFSLNPAVDLDEIALAPFQQTLGSVVIEEGAGLAAFVGCIEASANVVLGSMQYPGGGLQLSGGGIGLTTPWPDDQPRIVASFTAFVTDEEPAFIRLVGCPGHPQSPLAWSTVSPSQTFQFEVIAHGGINGSPPADESGCTGTSAKELDERSVAESTRIDVFPNPASGEVGFLLPDRAMGEAVRLTVHDVTGRLVREIHCGPLPGVRSLSWDGSGDDGRQVRGGVYFVRLAGGGLRATARFVLVR